VSEKKPPKRTWPLDKSGRLKEGCEDDGFGRAAQYEVPGAESAVPPDPNAPPRLIPQPHGGALMSKGTKGHKPPRGGVPAAVREAMRLSFEERLPKLEKIIDSPKSQDRDRIAAMGLLARYGLGAADHHEVAVRAEVLPREARNELLTDLRRKLDRLGERQQVIAEKADVQMLDSLPPGSWPVPESPTQPRLKKLPPAAETAPSEVPEVGSSNEKPSTELEPKPESKYDERTAHWALPGPVRFTPPAPGITGEYSSRRLFRETLS
jgi:hypothetical protein